MKTLTKKADLIITAFCIHEKMYYPKVVEIFLSQTPEDQKLQLKEMERTTHLKYNNQHMYDNLIAAAKIAQQTRKLIDKGIRHEVSKTASDDTFRSGLKSPRKLVN